jgi:hypothetical protein
MKGMFPEYREPTEQERTEAWQQGLFVFDASVLLNLYRYRKETRDEWFSVLASLASRIWIPHHIALEFQRNRLNVIADQNRAFAKVESAVKNAQTTFVSELSDLQLEKRHSLIDPQPLLTGLDELAKPFLSHVKTLRESQQSLTGPDLVRDKIEELFDGKVGPVPEQKEDIDKIYEEHSGGSTKKFPPGTKIKERERGKKKTKFVTRTRTMALFIRESSGTT